MASNFCRNCGFRLTPGKSFCGNCGTMVSTAVPAQAPVQSAPAPAVPAAPAAEPAPVQPEVSAPAAEPIVPEKPQPMQTVVTYHPEETVTKELPAEAVRQLAEVQETPAETALQVNEAAAVPVVPVVPASPVPATVPVAVPAPAPAPAAPAAPAVPQKKKHTGLIVGLICGAVALVLIAGILIVLFSGVISKANDARTGRTVLDRIEVMDEVSSGKNYTVYDKDFEKKIEEIRWWDYDGAMKSQGVYYHDAKKIAFSIKVNEKTDEKLYYAFFYSKDDDFTAGDLDKAEASDMITPSYYKDGSAYYNIECGKSLKPGHYCVIVSKDRTFNKPYAVAYARILDEMSKAE